MSINIKRNQLKRVVIVGGGLGGLRLAEDLSKANLTSSVLPYIAYDR